MDPLFQETLHHTPSCGPEISQEAQHLGPFHLSRDRKNQAQNVALTLLFK